MEWIEIARIVSRRMGCDGIALDERHFKPGASKLIGDTTTNNATANHGNLSPV